MEIVKTIAEKAGINENQAKMAVDLVVSLIKEKLPENVGQQVESLVKNNGDISGVIGDAVKNKLGDSLGGFFK